MRRELKAAAAGAAAEAGAAVGGGGAAGAAAGTVEGPGAVANLKAFCGRQMQMSEMCAARWQLFHFAYGLAWSCHFTLCKCQTYRR